MAVRILLAHDRQATAWKNGGGITREVAAHPPGAALEDFEWRVSFAEVAGGGPFSVFPGVDRIIALVAGQGMELRVDGQAVPVAEPYAPYAFSGDADVDCTLVDGPIVDFNVMARRGAISAAVEICRGSKEISAVADSVGLVVVLAGAAIVSKQEGADAAGAVKMTLGQYDAALLTDDAHVVIEPDGVVAVVNFLRDAG